MAEATEVTRTRRLEVVDERGRARIVLGEEAEETFGVSVLDKNGHPRVWVALHPYGPSITFAEAGNIVAEFGDYDDGPLAVTKGPFLVFCDEDGRPVLTLPEDWPQESD